MLIDSIMKSEDLMVVAFEMMSMFDFARVKFEGFFVLFEMLCLQRDDDEALCLAVMFMVQIKFDHEHESTSASSQRCLLFKIIAYKLMIKRVIVVH
jgi:hypothetical protein